LLAVSEPSSPEYGVYIQKAIHKIHALAHHALSAHASLRTFKGD